MTLSFSRPEPKISPVPVYGTGEIFPFIRSHAKSGSFWDSEYPGDSHASVHAGTRFVKDIFIHFEKARVS